MADERLLKDLLGQERFLVSGSYVAVDPGTDHTDSVVTPVNNLLTLAGVADGEARQSDKADLGENWASVQEVFGAFDFTDEEPGGGGSVDVHWAPSTSATTGTGNIAANSGSDADAPGGALGTILLAEFLRWCIPIGSLDIHDGAVVQNGYIGKFTPPTQWGQIIVANNSGDVFEDDNVEMAVWVNAVAMQLKTP